MCKPDFESDNHLISIHHVIGRGTQSDIILLENRQFEVLNKKLAGVYNGIAIIVGSVKVRVIPNFLLSPKLQGIENRFLTVKILSSNSGYRF